MGQAVVFTASVVSVNRPSFQAAHAGKYDLTVIVGTCIAEKVSVIVDIVDVTWAYRWNGRRRHYLHGRLKDTQLLAWGKVTLHTNGLNKLPGDIGGATGSTVSINTSGQYLVKVEVHGCRMSGNFFAHKEIKSGDLTHSWF